MPAYEWHRDFLQASLAELPDYLQSPDRFRTLAGHPPAGAPPFLQLTVGNLLLALDGLAATDAHAGGQRWAEVRSMEAEWEALRTRWAAHVERKALAELASRARQWGEYVRDAVEARSAVDYRDNLRPRLVAERLLHLLAGVPEAEVLRQALVHLDARLEPHLAPAGFVLEAALQPRYPEAGYPFLYRRPL